MKRLIATMAFALMAVSGVASADTMQNTVGNTLVVTTSTGAVVRYHFNADNTYTAAMPDGSSVNGAWEVAGDQICLTPAGGARGCTGYVADKNVGDSWTQTAVDGSSITVAITAGRQ